MKTSKAKLPRRRAVALVWMAIIGLVLITFMGLAIDTAWVYSTDAQLQVAADAAALAAARKVTTDTTSNTQLAAYNIAHANKAAGGLITLDYTPGTNDQTKDIVLGKWDSTTKIFTASTGSPLTPTPDAVQVKARRTANLFFGPIVGVSTFNSAATATAYMGSTSGPPAVIILGKSSPPAATPQSLVSAMKFNGGGTTLNVVSGGIYIDSSNASALTVTGGNPNITAPDIRIVGGYSVPQPLVPAPITGVAVYPDPLVNLPAYNYSGMPQLTQAKNQTSMTPGYYPDGILAGSGETVTLASGDYILGKVGLKSSGSGARFTGNGVLIYIIGQGSLNLSGTGVHTLTARTTGTYANIAVFQERTNTNGADFGGGASTVTGVIYLPNAALNVGSSATFNLGTQIIVNSFSITSGSTVNVPNGYRFGAGPFNSNPLPQLVK